MPACEVKADDGICHSIWVISDREQVSAITRIVDAMDSLYIADGHHRSAAASRVAAARGQGNPQHSGDVDYNYFLCVAFPHDEMRILDYNRVVKDLNGHVRGGLPGAHRPPVHRHAGGEAGPPGARRPVRHVPGGPVVPAGHPARH